MNPIYKKENASGRLKWQESKMVRDIQAAIEKKVAQDPNFTFRTATNEVELKALHAELTIDNVHYEDVSETPTAEAPKAQQQTNSAPEPEKAASTTSPDIDPFNSEQVKVREYVMDNDLPTQDDIKKTAEGVRTEFAEPKTHESAFEMDDDAFTDKKEKPRPNPSAQGPDKGNTKPQPQEPLNPSFNDIPDNQKRKKTKRLANSIVRTVAKFAEMGLAWYTSKDITDAKLAEYEVSGDLDLNVLLSLSETQEATARDFFIMQREKSQTDYKMTEEELDDQVDSLTEVLMAKGVALTPEQQLMFDVVKGYAPLIAKAIQNGNQIAYVVEMLKENTRQSRITQTPTPRASQYVPPTPAPTPPPAPTPEAEPKRQPEPEQFKDFGDLLNKRDEEEHILGHETETKE